MREIFQVMAGRGSQTSEDVKKSERLLSEGDIEISTMTKGKKWRGTLKVTTLGLKPGFNLEKLRIFM